MFPLCLLTITPGLWLFLTQPIHEHLAEVAISHEISVRPGKRSLSYLGISPVLDPSAIISFHQQDRLPSTLDHYRSGDRNYYGWRNDGWLLHRKRSLAALKNWM